MSLPTELAGHNPATVHGRSTSWGHPSRTYNESQFALSPGRGNQGFDSWVGGGQASDPSTPVNQMTSASSPVGYGSGSSPLPAYKRRKVFGMASAESAIEQSRTVPTSDRLQPTAGSATDVEARTKVAKLEETANKLLKKVEAMEERTRQLENVNANMKNANWLHMTIDNAEQLIANGVIIKNEAMMDDYEAQYVGSGFSRNGPTFTYHFMGDVYNEEYFIDDELVKIKYSIGPFKNCVRAVCAIPPNENNQRDLGIFWDMLANQWVIDWAQRWMTIV
jgi:hypothetical protein